MPDFLDKLARDALQTINDGYYEVENTVYYKPQNLSQTLRQAKGNPIIAELKAASPTRKKIKRNLKPLELADSMIKGGASGLSILTEPKHFKGSLTYIKEIARTQSCPILMKDFVLSEVQLKAAKRIGASAVLLISTLFSRGYGEVGLIDMINNAHREGLEILLETHSVEEFNAGLTTEVDLIGVNNRDLKTLKTDLKVTEKILLEARQTDKMIVSESGIQSASDIRFLRGCGANAYLIGSSIMESNNPESKVKELVKA